MDMNDCWCEWGIGMSLSSDNDVFLTGGVQYSNQRVVRRLLTNQRDDIWDLNYGGGIGALVGAPLIPGAIQQLIKFQMQLEQSVSQTPAPLVEVSEPQATNTVGAYIAYTESSTGQQTGLGV